MFKLSEQTNELFAALSKFQGELDNASKSKQGHGYKYADLAECINIAKAPLAATGLAVSQMLGQSESGKQTLITILTHSSGQYMMSEFDLVDATLMGGAGKNPAQVLGSAITYQRRYAYTAIIGMAQQDDDAASCVRVDSNVNNRANPNNHNKTQGSNVAWSEMAACYVPVNNKPVNNKQKLISQLKSAVINKGYTQKQSERQYGKPWEEMTEIELKNLIRDVASWTQNNAA